MKKVLPLLVALVVLLVGILPTWAVVIRSDNPAATTLCWTSGTEIFKAWGDGSHVQTLVSTPGWFAGMPSLSRDGRYLAYVAVDNPSYFMVIRVIDLRLRRQYQVTSGHYDIAPCWSPDGKFLVFARNMEGPDKLHIIDVRNPARPGVPIRLTNQPAWISEENPSWRDNILTYETDRTEYGRMEIWVREMITGEEYLFAGNTSTSARDPEISPDGQWIAYEARPWWLDDWGRIHEDEPRVHIKRLADGFNTELLSAVSYFPAWAPGSQAVYFTSTMDGTVATYRATIDENGGLTGVSWVAGSDWPDYAYWPTASWTMRPIRAIYTPFRRLN